MIQCVGSREPDNPNCSRICCQTAIKNALRLKALNADTQIYMLYRDMRTYGFSGGLLPPKPGRRALSSSAIN
jgi:heterodisulfide reductase subunit A2